MTCDRCPHLTEIEAALAPCQKCEAGKLHGQVNYDAIAYQAQANATIKARMMQNAVTTLAPEVEDTLRIALSTVFAFDPVEILLLRHILAGGTYASFNRPLRELTDRLAKYDLAEGAPGFRQLAKTWADRMTGAMPALDDLFRATVEANGGRTRPLRF